METYNNLNDELIIGDNHWEYPYEPQKDYQSLSLDGKTRVLFKNLEMELIQLIRQADIIVGCVAWLTNETILDALTQVKGIAIVVQKEDFLRPDIYAQHNWKSRLRILYERLPGTLSRYDEGWIGTVLHMMSCAGDPGIDAIRCVGNLNTKKDPAFPRAHHKFLVFCKMLEDNHNSKWENQFVPYKVWTGSFNLTKNATLSLENAIVSSDPNIVRAYFHEAAQVLALSEPLNWEEPWMEPQWRIGT